MRKRTRTQPGLPEQGRLTAGDACSSGPATASRYSANCEVEYFRTVISSSKER
jgi:hypothetical protein